MFSTGVFSSFGGSYSAPSASSIMNFKSEISYDTSSRDPAALQARVFVGNLNTNRITRDDVIQMFQAYGTLAGVTLFKGYAFVQYSHAAEANLAVSALNGYNWNGSVLDVKLAANGMKSTTVSTLATKRGADAHGTPKAKKAAIGYEREINNENKMYASTISTPVQEIMDHVESTDTLICGECRFITSKIDDFISHRRNPCQVAKIEGEPKKMQCFTCADEFLTSWLLVKHLTSVHKMILFKEITPDGDGVHNGNSNERSVETPNGGKTEKTFTDEP